MTTDVDGSTDETDDVYLVLAQRTADVYHTNPDCRMLDKSDREARSESERYIEWHDIDECELCSGAASSAPVERKQYDLDDDETPAPPYYVASGQGNTGIYHSDPECVKLKSETHERPEHYIEWHDMTHCDRCQGRLGRNAVVVNRVDEIRQRLLDGEAIDKVAERYGVVRQTIRRVARGSRNYEGRADKIGPLVYSRELEGYALEAETPDENTFLNDSYSDSETSQTGAVAND